MIIKIILTALITTGALIGAYWIGRKHGNDRAHDEIMDALIDMLDGKEYATFSMTVITPDGEADYIAQFQRVRTDGVLTLTEEDIKRARDIMRGDK